MIIADDCIDATIYFLKLVVVVKGRCYNEFTLYHLRKLFLLSYQSLF